MVIILVVVVVIIFAVVRHHVWLIVAVVAFLVDGAVRIAGGGHFLAGVHRDNVGQSQRAGPRMEAASAAEEVLRAVFRVADVPVRHRTYAADRVEARVDTDPFLTRREYLFTAYNTWDIIKTRTSEAAE